MFNRTVKCVDCGHVFDYEDRAIVEEHRFDDGFTEAFAHCPKCGGDFDAGISCDRCGEIFTPDEMEGTLCRECLESYSYDVDTCVEAGEYLTLTVELNGLLASLFTPQQVNTLLLRELREAQRITPIDCSAFLKFYAEEFGEVVFRKKGKEVR